MARRHTQVAVVGLTLLGMLLAACGSPSATHSTTPHATATAAPGPTPAPTAPPLSVPPAPLSVYYGAEGDSNGHCCMVYALSATDGSVRWQHKVSSAVVGVVVSGGGVYAELPNLSELIALRASDGMQLWHVATHILHSSFVLANGVIYTGSVAYSNTHGYVDAYRASDGTRLWEYDGGACSFYEMAVDASAVYVSSAACHGVLALRASDGSVFWHSQDATLHGGISAANGIVYVNNYGDVYALSASNGTQVWHDSFSQDGEGGFAPSIANGVIYVTTYAAVYALQATSGTLLWRALGTQMLTPVVAGGAVYLAPQDYEPQGNPLIALRASDGTLIWRVVKKGIFSPPVSLNGTLYVTLGPQVPGETSSYTYTVYALHASDGSVIWQHTAKDGGATSVAVG